MIYSDKWPKIKYWPETGSVQELYYFIVKLGEHTVPKYASLLTQHHSQKNTNFLEYFYDFEKDEKFSIFFHEKTLIRFVITNYIYFILFSSCGYINLLLTAGQRLFDDNLSKRCRLIRIAYKRIIIISSHIITTCTFAPYRSRTKRPLIKKDPSLHTKDQPCETPVHLALRFKHG